MARAIPLKKICAHCKYWDENTKPNNDTEKNMSACRRYPRGAAALNTDGELHTYSVISFTCYDEWCGEWKPKVIPKKR
jgi:hypothetical protein